MGQYYRIAFKHEGKRVVVNDRQIKGEGYIMAKLLEHSWLGCDIADAVAREMYGNPLRLAWVGDHKHESPADDNGFDYSHKWLVNHDKKLAVSFDEYIAASKTKYGVIAPFPLLTAIGNNRGGGDYYESHSDFDKVGTWVWDLISIEDAKPEGYEDFRVVFKEG